MAEVNSSEKSFKGLFEFDIGKMAINPSMSEEFMRPIVDDVVEKVGCGHPELL